MKRLILILVFTISHFTYAANSVVTIDNGASITIGSGAYFCADEIIVNSGGSFTSQSPDDVCVTPTGEGDISLPVELTSFVARQEENFVVLEWVTESEVENLGFIIERREASAEHTPNPSQEGTDEGEWMEIASYLTHPELQGQGSVTYQTEYRFVDSTVVGGVTYDYRLADVSYDGVVVYHGLTTLTVEPYVEIPDEFALYQNFPNPFNPITTFKYGLPEPSYVTLKIYNIVGKEVVTLVDEYKLAGYHHVRWDASKVGSGVYFYHLRAGKLSQVGKCLVLK